MSIMRIVTMLWLSAIVRQPQLLLVSSAGLTGNLDDNDTKPNCAQYFVLASPDVPVMVLRPVRFGTMCR